MKIWDSVYVCLAKQILYELHPKANNSWRKTQNFFVADIEKLFVEEG